MRGNVPELVKVYRSGSVGVEHSYHHAYGVGVKGRPVAVYKRGSQFSFGEFSTSYRKR